MTQLQLSTHMSMWLVSSSVHYQSSSAHYHSHNSAATLYTLKHVSSVKLSTLPIKLCTLPIHMCPVPEVSSSPWSSTTLTFVPVSAPPMGTGSLTLLQRKTWIKMLSFFLSSYRNLASQPKNSHLTLVQCSKRYSALSFCPAKRFALYKSNPLSLLSL